MKINDIFECSDGVFPQEALDLCEDGKAYIAELDPVDGVRRFQIVAVPEPTFEEQVEAAYAAFDSNVEKRLNDFAATRRYASIYTACIATASQIEKYAAEGAYCFKMWGETYAKCEELLAEYMPDVLAGKRPIPTWEEIEAQLPPLVWPDGQTEAGEFAKVMQDEADNSEQPEQAEAAE